MKKTLSFILVLAMVLCMSVTAFAAGEKSGSMTVTVNVPDNTPSYTMSIPSNITLDPTKTDWQEVSGTLGVTNVSNVPVKHYIEVDIQTGELKKAGSTETIPYHFGIKNVLVTGDYLEHCLEAIVYDNDVGENYGNYYIAIKVESWADVTPGTYTGTVTFNFEILDDNMNP